MLFSLSSSLQFSIFLMMLAQKVGIFLKSTLKKALWFVFRIRYFVFFVNATKFFNVFF